MHLSEIGFWQALVHEALDRFAKRDGYLIRVNSSERNMTSKLGGYLSSLADTYDLDVDCEYSRNGTEFKKIVLTNVDEAEYEGSTEASRVFPDIIIHRRGEAGPNFLILEAKKIGFSQKRDIEKIQKYVVDTGSGGLNYKLGLILVIPSKPDSEWRLRWFDQSGLEVLSYNHDWKK